MLISGVDNTMQETVKQEKHLYEYAVDPNSLTAGAFVVEFVGRNQRVLEVGCGPGSITRVLATARQCKVTGIELDPQAIEKVRPFCEAVMSADLNNPDWPKLVADRGPFDVVIAADVLEHLYDPWNNLERMAGLLGPNGHLVISLPHACHAALVAGLVGGDVHYRDWGLLDRTHIRFFGLTNIQTLFENAGLKIIDYRFVIKSPQETEFAEQWARLPSGMRSALASVPHADIYQVVIKAVPLNQAGEALKLKPAPRKRTPPFAIWKSRIKTAVSRRLSPYPRIKDSARKIARLLGSN